MIPPWQRLVLAFAALLVLGSGLLALVYVDTVGEKVIGKDNMVYYFSASELVQPDGPGLKGATVRLGGMVLPGNEPNWREILPLRFFVTDGKTTVAVHSTGAAPQMFREGIGVIVEGYFDQDQVFQTDRVMVKHNNEYRVPTGETDMNELAGSLEEPAT